MDIPEDHINNSKDLPLEDIMTKSFKALEFYSNGLVEFSINNQTEKCINLFESAIQEDSTFAGALLILTVSYFQNNQIEKARMSIRSAMDNLYKLPERQQFQTKFFHYAFREEPKKATAVIKMWVELYPDDIDGRMMLASRYYMSNRINEAIHQYKTILTIDPELYDHLITIGEIYRQQGIFDSAAMYFQQYADQFPKDIKSYQELSNLYLTTGEFDLAIKNLNKALLIEPDKVSLMIDLADVYLRTGDFQEAFKNYDEAMEIHKSAIDLARIYDGFTRYYRLKGQPQMTLEYFKKTIDKMKEFQQPLRILVTQVFNIDKYIEAGKNDEAFELLKQIESQFEAPVDKVVAFGYIFGYLELKDADNAEKYIPEAEEIAISFGEEMLLANISYAWAKIFEIRNDHEKAIEMYLEFLDKQPTSYSMNRFIARCYRKLNNLKKAEEHILLALRYYPSWPKVNYEAALIYIDKGEQEKAIEHLQKAVEVWKDADEDYEPAIEARQALAEFGT